MGRIPPQGTECILGRILQSQITFRIGNEQRICTSIKANEREQMDELLPYLIRT